MLKFYDVDKEYVKYLQKFETKIPNISYENRDKFVCGIVLSISGQEYYAPISSFNKPQRTNILIKNSNNRIVGSIRLSFMFPIPKSCIKIKDFSIEEQKYKRLLMEELEFCNRNITQIKEKAIYIHNSVVETKDDLAIKNCCNFKLLEEKCLDYCRANGIEMPQDFYYTKIDKALELKLAATGIKYNATASKDEPEKILIRCSSDDQAALKEFINKNAALKV